MRCTLYVYGFTVHGRIKGKSEVPLSAFPARDATGHAPGVTDSDTGLTATSTKTNAKFMPAVRCGRGESGTMSISYQRHIITGDTLYNACSQEFYTYSFDIAAVFRFSLESSLEVSDGAPRAPWRAAQPKKPTSIRRHTRRNESS